MTKEAGSRVYSLSEYDRKSVKEIESRLKSKEISKKEIDVYFEFLEKLSLKIRGVLQKEKGEGITNLKLEKDLRKITGLMNQVAALAERP